MILIQDGVALAFINDVTKKVGTEHYSPYLGRMRRSRRWTTIAPLTCNAEAVSSTMQ